MAETASSSSSGPPTAKQRGLAIASIVLLGVGVIVTIDFLLGNVAALLIGLIGLAVGAGGAWAVVTGTGARRVAGVGAAAVGIVVVLLAVVLVVSGPHQIVLHVGVIVVAVALSAALARTAMADEVRAGLGVAEVHAPRHPVLICNPKSGGGKVEKFELVQLATKLGVEVVVLQPGDDLEQLARDAVARGADCLGMAGGDGSQALVASIAVEHDLPFVCVSAGTRNHFALDLGLNRDDPRETLSAFYDGLERRIDHATMDGRFIVNNASLGVYATIVQEDDYRDNKAGTTKMLLPELLGRQAEPFDLQFTDPDGNEVDGAFLVQVSNNPYVIGASFDAAQRRRMDTGLLGVVAITASSGVEAAQLMALSAVGRRQRSRQWHEFTCTELEIRSRSGTAAVGVDGEALVVDTPIRFRIHPRGLRILVPESSIDTARRRTSRDLGVNDLVGMAVGR